MNTVSATETTRSPEVDTAARGRAAVLSWTFLLVVYLSLQLYLWLVVPGRNTLWIAAGAIVILAIMVVDPIRRRERPAALGLTFENFLPACRLLVPGMVAALLVLVILHFTAADAPEHPSFVKRFIQILPWALLQQGLLQATFNRRLERLLGPGLRSSLTNGVFFGAMHLPGALLTIMTFVAGTWWSWIYQKRPNLWALILSHAILSAAAQGLLPGAWTHGFRVGPGYFRWH